MPQQTVFLATELKQLLYTYRETAELLAASEGFVKQLAQTGQLKRIFLTPELFSKQPRITSQSIVDYIKGKIADSERPAAST